MKTLLIVIISTILLRPTAHCDTVVVYGNIVAIVYLSIVDQIECNQLKNWNLFEMRVDSALHFKDTIRYDSYDQFITNARYLVVHDSLKLKTKESYLAT